MAVELFLDDDVTPLDDEAYNPVAGGIGTTVEVHVWNEKGNPSGQDLAGLLLIVETESLTSPGTWLRSGLPPQDELWTQVRLIGHDNAGDTSQQNLVTDWRRIGASRALEIPSLHADCARYLEVRDRATNYASAVTYRRRLVVLVDEHAVPVPFGAAHVRGILIGLGDPSRSGIVRGGVVSVSGSPDDEVHVAPTLYLWAGLLYGIVTVDEQLDQNDGAAEALTAGQYYWAVLTLDATGVVKTKGLRGAAPARPTPPAGIFLRWVKVDYQAGGTAVIEAADLDGDVVRDRFYLEAGDGLELIVHAGQALAGGTHRTWSGRASVTLPGTATRHLWQVATGLYELTADEVAPEDTALGPLASVTTDGAAVTAIVDRRTYVEPLVVLRFAGAFAVGSLGVQAVVHPRLAIEGVVLVVDDNGGGASGETVVDVHLDGTTIYTSQGTDDQRPRVAFDAAQLRADGGVHEVTDVRAGSLLEVIVDDEPVGGSPTSIEVLVLCREVR